MRASLLFACVVMGLSIFACEAVPPLVFPDAGNDGGTTGGTTSGSTSGSGDSGADADAAVDGSAFGCPSAPQANITCCGAQACSGACTPSECSECATTCTNLGEVCCAKSGKNKCAKRPEDC